MSTLYHEILAFCNDSCAFFLPLSQFLYSLVKVPISVKTTALFAVDTDNIKTILEQSSATQKFESIGFFRDGKIYVTNAFLNSLNRHGLSPEGFLKHPANEMYEMFNAALTKALRSRIGSQPPQYSNKVLLQETKEIYKKTPMFRASVSLPELYYTDCFDYGRNAPADKNLTTDADIEEYLDDSEQWVTNRLNRWFSDEKVNYRLTNYMKRLLIIEATIDEIRSIPAFSWKREKRFLDAIAGKKIVTLDVKHGDDILTFKYEAAQLQDTDECYSPSGIPVADRPGVLGAINEFTFNDILKVKYRGKIIYEQ